MAPGFCTPETLEYLTSRIVSQRKPKPGRKALNDVLVRVVGALKAPNRRDGLKFGIFIVRGPSTPPLTPET
jgi:hypothetical protein